MDIKLQDIPHLGNGYWKKVTSADGFVLGEIMTVHASLNRITGWTFKKFDDKPCQMHRTYKTGRDALNALIKSVEKVTK